MPLDASVLTRKYGPLPGWAWAGVAAGGAYLWWRHQNATGAAATTGTTGSASDLGDAAAQADQDYGNPYNGAGVYTDLAAAQAREQRQAARLDLESKRLAFARHRQAGIRSRQAAGKVNRQTRVYTAGERTTLADVAARFGVSLAKLKRANPHVSGLRVHKGERLHIPT